MLVPSAGFAISAEYLSAGTASSSLAILCLALIFASQLSQQSESPSEERSRIYYIGFRGDTLAPRKDIRSKIDLAAANAADAPVEKLAEKSASSQTTIR
jgi:hypothetical protein